MCARLGLKCIVYMGAKDMERQALNVFRMRLMGAEVRPVTYGTATLKDATSEAIRDWVTNVETTHYILGSAAGPHPYPMMVRSRSCRQEQGLPFLGGRGEETGSSSVGSFWPLAAKCRHVLRRTTVAGWCAAPACPLICPAALLSCLPGCC